MSYHDDCRRILAGLIDSQLDWERRQAAAERREAERKFRSFVWPYDRHDTLGPRFSGRFMWPWKKS